MQESIELTFEELASIGERAREQGDMSKATEHFALALAGGYRKSDGSQIVKSFTHLSRLYYLQYVESLGTNKELLEDMRRFAAAAHKEATERGVKGRVVCLAQTIVGSYYRETRNNYEAIKHFHNAVISLPDHLQEYPEIHICYFLAKILDSKTEEGWLGRMVQKASVILKPGYRDNWATLIAGCSANRQLVEAFAHLNMLQEAQRYLDEAKQDAIAMQEHGLPHGIYHLQMLKAKLSPILDFSGVD